MKKMMAILIVFTLEILYLCYQVGVLRRECRQAISDNALINASMLDNSNASLKCALSALSQVETDIADRDSMTAAEKKLMRARLLVLKNSRDSLLGSIMKEK